MAFFAVAVLARDNIVVFGFFHHHDFVNAPFSSSGNAPNVQGYLFFSIPLSGYARIERLQMIMFMMVMLMVIMMVMVILVVMMVMMVMVIMLLVMVMVMMLLVMSCHYDEYDGGRC